MPSDWLVYRPTSHLGLLAAKQAADVGLGTEGIRAHGNTVLVAEHGRDQPMAIPPICTNLSNFRSVAPAPMIEDVSFLVYNFGRTLGIEPPP
jgi:hypothetical protein